MLKAQGLADAAVVSPVGACRSVPQEVNGIPGPSFGYEHAVIQIGGGAKLGEDADENLVGQPVYRRPARVLDLHILEVGNAQR